MFVEYIRLPSPQRTPPRSSNTIQFKRQIKYNQSINRGTFSLKSHHSLCVSVLDVNTKDIHIKATAAPASVYAVRDGNRRLTPATPIMERYMYIREMHMCVVSVSSQVSFEMSATWWVACVWRFYLINWSLRTDKRIGYLFCKLEYLREKKSTLTYCRICYFQFDIDRNNHKIHVRFLNSLKDQTLKWLYCHSYFEFFPPTVVS